MASLGHVMFGLTVAAAHDAAAPPRLRALRIAGAVAFPILAMLPDVDVVGFKLGVKYADTWGHRGAGHSLAVAVVAGLVVAPLLARFLRAPLPITAACAVIAVVSHGVFDMLTDGGLGVATLWPLDGDRFFLPWRPIPVAPIGAAFLSARGLRCAATELVLFAPFLVLAARLWRRRRRTSPAP